MEEHEKEFLSDSRKRVLVLIFFFFLNNNHTKRIMTSSVDFEPILAELEADKELGEKLREQVKELERTFRIAAKVLNKSHSTPSSQSE